MKRFARRLALTILLATALSYRQWVHRITVSLSHKPVGRAGENYKKGAYS